MRDLSPRARSLRAFVLERGSRGPGSRLADIVRGLAGSAAVAFLVSQSACPIVALVSRLAPTPPGANATFAGPDADDCPPCQLAGGTDCWEELLRWIEAQFNGEGGLPFPAGECFADDEGGGGGEGIA